VGRRRADELFDLTPTPAAYVRYFVRHPTTQLMPRKIKTAFDGTPGEDRSLTGIHDIAFIARERDGVRGVEVRVGGGTSIMPRVAPTLYDFVGLDDGEYLEVAEAVFRIFDRQDFLRVNRARARIKVLVDKIGMEEFRRLVDEERNGSWVAERHFDVEGLRLDVDEEASAPAKPATFASPSAEGGVMSDLSEFERFRASNVRAQRQPGFSAVQVKITRGRPEPAPAARSWPTSGAGTRAATSAPTCTRTSSCAGCATRRLRGLEGAAGARARRRRADQINDVRLVPRHGLVQARHHLSMGLNQACRSASRR
jgi:hypothetical protein